MSDFLIAEGFGSYKDGIHESPNLGGGTDTEVLGSQWKAYSNSFSLEDIGDGRKWIKRNGTVPHEFDFRSYNFDPVTTIHCCMRILPNSVNTTRVQLFRLYDRSWIVGQIGLDTANKVVYTTHTAGRIDTSIVFTADDALAVDAENFIEVSVVLGHGTSGSVALYINGLLINETTGIDTIGTSGSSNCNNVGVFGWGYGQAHQQPFPEGWKATDIIIHKKSSPILKDMGVFYYPAEVDGADTDFTPSSGTDHYAMVDEVGPDEDTTYNESDGTSGDRDSYEIAATVTAGEVMSVGTFAKARKTEMGGRSVQLGVGHSSSENQSESIPLVEDYHALMHLEDLNPSTGLAWTVSEAQQAIASVEVD